jgi:hypothetical protein
MQKKMTSNFNLVARTAFFLLLLINIGCSGHMKRMDKGLSSDAGAIMYEYDLNKCPTNDSTLPLSKSTRDYSIQAGTMNSQNTFITKVPYCHSFTKYAFKKIPSDFYVFTAYVKLERRKNSCSILLATPSEITSLNEATNQCSEVEEQAKYVDAFLSTLLATESSTVLKPNPKVTIFKNMPDWVSSCHKNIRKKYWE